MTKILKKILTGLTVAAVITMGLSSCDTQKEKKAEKLKIGYVNWAEGVAVAHLTQYLLKERMDVEVELVMADVAPIFTAIASGQQDMLIESWLPITHESYLKKYGTKVHVLGEWFSSAKIGLVVPSHVQANSIADLNKYKDQFEGKIVGIDPGAGIMKTTEKAIEAYGLDYKLMSSSGPAMTASLKRANDKKKAVVVTGWAPHWKFAKWDLKFLDDPKGAFGDVEKIHTIVRNGFEEDWPKVAEVFKKMNFSGKQIGSLMALMKVHKDDTNKALTQWITENQSTVDSWFQ